ncbi:MAG: sigma-70 family RNA polymerase sigma factor [Planctomycetaceae bacterium]
MTEWNRNHDPSIADILARRYLPQFWRTSRALLGCPDLAEDVAQDAMVKLLHALERFDGRAAFRTWSYTILINTVRNELRRQRTGGKHLEEGFDVANSARIAPVDERLLTAEARRVVDEALQRLTEKQRSAFVLMVLEGLQASEVAELEGCSVDAVYQRVTDARKLLRQDVSLNQLVQTK